MKKKRNIFLIGVFIVPLVLIFSQCLTISAKPDPRGDVFAGSSTSIKCHKDVYDNYLHTAHFSTTRLADIHTIGGNFNGHDNTFYFSKDLKIVMESRPDGLYQVAYNKGKEVKAERFDITFGGVKAESYLSWQGNQIYQLPMSYFKALNGWTNSPGFDSTYADYSRTIGRRCFECHSSYIKDLPSQNQSFTAVLSKEEFDKNSLILGIDCERCHGPAANHVNYQTQFPEEKKAKYIATYASLSREAKINMCAVCHSGNKNHIVHTVFAYKPSDKLSDFVETPPYQLPGDSTKLDVHANQSQLLGSSKCFINSNMDCATCHDVHHNERQNLALFSQKCMNCHTTANHNFCPLASKLGAAIKSNCIDCHMPAKPSSVIAVETQGSGKKEPYLVRTHHIAIYPEESQKIIEYLKKNNKLASK